MVRFLEVVREVSWVSYTPTQTHKGRYAITQAAGDLSTAIGKRRFSDGNFGDDDNELTDKGRGEPNVVTASLTHPGQASDVAALWGPFPHDRQRFTTTDVCTIR